ncbi:ionotropic receptor 21a-like [Macrobrachium rosenbergii]|uniref:ionotropic receptor 21a-like n=1 Tax=Macrobrachium rosenbergii TaxID=79674 RepID=UPI0034D53114
MWWTEMFRQEIFIANGFTEAADEEGDTNTTLSKFLETIATARKLRRLSRNELVVVVSANVEFVKSFAEYSLKGRLLVWSSRFILVTKLPVLNLQQLLMNHWTFLMMNAMAINSEMILGRTRWSVYTAMPYSPKGKQITRVASWTQDKGLKFLTSFGVFPEKFTNFYGAEVNISVLTYSPYWTTTQTTNSDGTVTESYKGSDAMFMAAIAKALNFKIYNVPAESWDDVAKKVHERKAFMSPIVHFVFPQRMDRYDYSYPYELAPMVFCASKPALKPSWQSLYYPFAGDVWLAILIVLILFPVVLLMSLSNKLSAADSFRVLTTSWLVFAFIIGTAYRGNLTAWLTLPKYPPRAETISDLIRVADRVTSPPYGEEFRTFFQQSSSPEFKRLAQLMDVGPTVLEGLQRASNSREAYLDEKRYIEHNIARHFTRADGSTGLYLGRESILPGLAAWPMSFDAPFRPQIDSLMMAVLEAGLYNKWSADTIEEARLEGQKQKKREEKINNEDGGNSTANQALTITHMQGLFILLLSGLLMATLSFITELFIVKFYGKP